MDQKCAICGRVLVTANSDDPTRAHTQNPVTHYCWVNEEATVRMACSVHFNFPWQSFRAMTKLGPPEDQFNADLPECYIRFAETFIKETL